VAFSLFVAFAFGALATANALSPNFTPLSYVPLAYSIGLGIYLINHFRRL
jgi:hypothetical protein